MNPLPDRIAAALTAYSQSVEDHTNASSVPSASKMLACLQDLTTAIAELVAERDRYHSALVARHGGEPLALLSELDEARAERDAAVAKCAELERELAAANGKLAGLCRSLRRVHARIEVGIREHGSDGCKVFATLLELHELGPAAIAAAEQGGA